jgi:hypothetical protein
MRMMQVHALLADPHWRLAWLVFAAFVAGVLNAVAGGGSFLSFPALLGMHIPPVQANATNTVAIWPGQVTSVAAYWKDVRKHPRVAWLMALAGLAGGTAGAVVLLNTPQKTFMHLVPWLLLGAALTFAVSTPVSRAFQRRNALRAQLASAGTLSSGLENGAATGTATDAASPSDDAVPMPPRVPLFVASMLVSFYVGYFGAGAGFLFMTLLALFGYQDIHVINALKVVTNTLANGIAFAIFIVDGQVAWRYCLAAMVAAAIGGYASASLAHKVPQPVLRWLVVVIGLGMAAWFFVRQ